MSEDTLHTSLARNRISRREFIVLSWVGLLGVLFVKLLDLGLRMVNPPRRSGAFGGVFDLGPLADLPGVGEDPLPVPAGKFWLVRNAAGLLALHKVCTHLDCLCDWNTATETFACPCHGSEFGLDGAYLNGPAGRSLDRFVIRLVDASGAMVAETDEARGTPLPVPEPSSAEDGSLIEPELKVQVDTGRKILGATAR